MKKYFVDLHVHIGRSSDGHVIKMGTANNLTFEQIAYEAKNRKGIDIIGVVDAISPYVIRDIEKLLESGELVELKEGGFIYRDSIMIIAGAEIETREKEAGSAHSLAFFPHLEGIKAFSKEIKSHMKNIYKNSTMSRLTLNELFQLVLDMGGLYIPAHVFTPYKGVYGNCTDRLRNVYDSNIFKHIYAIELGLSADTYMAYNISELDDMTFLSNSDAHSLPKMGREYNVMELESLNYKEVVMALKCEEGRGIVGNYGLDPRLGKYHRTFCIQCNSVIEGEPPIVECNFDSSHRVIMGVLDRLEIIGDRHVDYSDGRPPYHYQVPLEFLPGIGPKTIDKLIEHFGTEMNIIHRADYNNISDIVGEKIAKRILSARKGNLNIVYGGGGIYGKVGK